ncbi:MAG: hypothetical protein Q8907_06505 [Bacteroidota bacterium]|nr:hypothetical protein [Bacteroidota bacterium]MDP4226544.1 hypothetical protein [Bacteroidota bacterium]MDP4273913.1 hypothetical protein [Bacteroidota bacterium]
MKVIAYILSIYVLVLIAIPCADKPDDNLLHKPEITQGSPSGHHQDMDHCSPFCVCSCCASPVVLQFYAFPANLIYVQVDFPELVPDFHSATLNSVWQPPRLS